MKSLPPVDSCCTHPAPTWWFVKVRPFGETKEPEPMLNRTDDRRTWSSHCWLGSNPYFAFTRAFGKALNSHMPSSAAATPASMSAEVISSTARFNMNVSHAVGHAREFHNLNPGLPV